MRHLLLPLTLLLASCTSAPPPLESPPAYSKPPAVASDGFVSVVVSADVPMSVTDLREFLLETPFITFLEPTENIAPPVSSEPLQGDWLTPGAVRRLQLKDGHYVIERVLENEPEIFSYQAWVFTNAAGRGVDHIYGVQRFLELGPNETRFEWTYNVKPKSALTGIFVRRQVPELTEFMQTGADAMAAAVTSAVANAE